MPYPGQSGKQCTALRLQTFQPSILRACTLWLAEMMIHNAQQHPLKKLDFSVSFDQDIEIDFEIVVLCWRQCLQGTQCHVDQRQAMVCFQCSDLPGHDFSQFGQTPFGVLFELVNLLPITLRDAGVIAYCLLLEHSSLKAFYLLGKQFEGAMKKRRIIQQRRRVDDAYMSQWFRFSPVSLPLTQVQTEAVEQPVSVRKA